MKRIKESDRAIQGINVVPIIDVCLVLLVILFIMTPVLNFDKVPLELPEAMTKETKDQNITVSLGSDGRITVDSALTTLQEIPWRLKRAIGARDKAVIVVRADKHLPYGKVEELIKLVNQFAGTNAVAIATKQRDKPLEASRP